MISMYLQIGFATIKLTRIVHSDPLTEMIQSISKILSDDEQLKY
jgi:hypothetical protein